MVATVSPAATAAPLPRPTAGASPAVASPGSTLIAALVADGILEVRRPGSQRVRYAIPSGCNPSAVAPGVVFVCTQQQGGPLELNLTTGILTPVTVGRLSAPSPGLTETFELTRAGTHWLEGAVDRRSDSGGSSLRDAVIVNRATGQIIDLTGPQAPARGSRRYIDLSAARPARALCKPVRRSRSGPSGTFYGLSKVGSWTLTKKPGGNPSVHVLQRCGSQRATRLQAGAKPILGRGAAAWFDGRDIRVRDLASGRERTFTWFRRGLGRPTLAFSANRLVVSAVAFAEGQPYFRIHLIAV